MSAICRTEPVTLASDSLVLTWKLSPAARKKLKSYGTIIIFVTLIVTAWKPCIFLGDVQSVNIKITAVKSCACC